MRCYQLVVRSERAVGAGGLVGGELIAGRGVAKQRVYARLAHHHRVAHRQDQHELAHLCKIGRGLTYTNSANKNQRGPKIKTLRAVMLVLIMALSDVDTVGLVRTESMQEPPAGQTTRNKNFTRIRNTR